MAYDNTNRGSIWKNKKMREGKQDADFTGTLNVNGVEYWVNAWKRKEDASPEAPSLSFSIRPKEDQPQQSITQRAQSTIKRPDSISSGPIGYSNIPKNDMDDDIPFSAEFR